jgi:VWFA-related protein
MTTSRGFCRVDLASALVLLALAIAPAAPRALQQAAPSERAPTATLLEVTALDRNGRVADSLGPASFTVTVDGRPRRILWVRFVSRGPGALADAQRRQRSRTDELFFAAEPARNVIVVVDEASLQRGSERVVLQAAGALIDRLGLDDAIGVIRVPIPRDSRVTLTTLRPEVREALRQVTARAAQPGAPARAAVEPRAAEPTRAPGRPGEAPGVERPPVDDNLDRPAVGDELPAVRAFFDSFEGVLAALQSAPGRKVLAVFSGGLLGSSVVRLDEVARAAVAAGAVVYAFEIPGVHDDLASAPDLPALERLARATGGSSVALGRNPDRSVERVVTELGACYVLGIESAPADSDGGRHAVHVETPKLSLALRVPSWIMARADVPDIVPAALVAEPAPVSVPGAPSISPAPPRAARPPARDAELERLLGRASDYVIGYQREYSLLVAEENYLQSARGVRQQIRSDLLLVRRPADDGWVSFRDVFEVNRVIVRDREERLKRLFLDPSAEAQAQLRAIKEESARYNIGGRTINVPLFPLKFLEPDNLRHFEYKAAGQQNVGGVEASRVAFAEWARPTLVRYSPDQIPVISNSQLRDIPASGWFLVDPVSGAIVGTRMQLTYDPDSVVYQIEVRYQRDAALGLWVPQEMRETYSIGRPGSSDRSVLLDGRATYSKFRRFQVTTREQITIPK